MFGAVINQLIDTWDARTYPKSVREQLSGVKSLIDAYYQREVELDNPQDSDSLEAILRENKFADGFHRFIENNLMSCLDSEVIRGWHYCRLTEHEAQAMENGVLVSSSKASLRQRLENLSKEFQLSDKNIEAICEASPLSNEQQRKVRSHRFFMVSKPLPLDDSGVRPLIKFWGGEVAYFWLKDERLKQKLAAVGAPRIVECNVPVRGNKLAYRAATNIVETFCKVSQVPSAFDFHVSPKEGSLKILKVHSEGDPVFDELNLERPQ